jgi:hypothetical protein
VKRWIGLTGKMGAGKDYSFSTLNQMLPPRITNTRGEVWVRAQVARCSFADGLRKEIQETLQAEIPALWSKPYPEEIRRLLQWWGTDLRRAEDPNYWVEKGIQAARDLLQVPVMEDAVPVFTDVRFPNEAEAIRAEGGLIVRVWAPEGVRRRRLGEDPPQHASETALDGYEVDYVVRSYGSQNTYRQQLAEVATQAGLLGAE